MKERYRDELNWLEKLLGVWRVNRGSYDTTWGYFAPKWVVQLSIDRGSYFNKSYYLNIGFIWGAFHIRLPFKTRLEESCEWKTYGFETHENSIIFRWGSKYTFWYIPFVSFEFDFKKEFEEEVHDYTYTLSCGEVQHRKATCRREFWQWHRKWFPFLKLKRDSINIEFDDEVGEQTGSWKGGTIGCGYDMLQGETIEQCLRRMEKERKFN